MICLVPRWFSLLASFVCVVNSNFVHLNIFFVMISTVSNIFHAVDCAIQSSFSQFVVVYTSPRLLIHSHHVLHMLCSLRFAWFCHSIYHVKLGQPLVKSFQFLWIFYCGVCCRVCTVEDDHQFSFQQVHYLASNFDCIDFSWPPVGNFLMQKFWYHCRLGHCSI